MSVRTATQTSFLTQIQARVRANLASLLLVFVSAGFLFLLAELLLAGHTEGIQLVAVIAGIAGAVLGFVGLFARGRLRYALAVLFLILALTGIIGVIEHNEERFEGKEAAAVPALVQADSGYTLTAYRTDRGEDDEGEAGEQEKEAPPLAPLSLSGLSVLGAMALLAKGDE